MSKDRGVDLRAEILRGDLDAELELIAKAIELRQKRVAEELRFELSIGDVVRMTNSGRPKYLRGLRVRVTEVLEYSVRCEIVDADKAAAGRYGYGEFKCPLTLLDPASVHGAA